MKYQGAYYEGNEYAVGDVVVAPDRVAYHLLKPAPAGTDPKNTMYWNRASDILNEVILMFHDMFEGMKAQLTTIPTNIGESGIILKSTDETSSAEYLLTVDESGEEPEVVATLIEPESEEDDTEGAGTEGDDT